MSGELTPDERPREPAGLPWGPTGQGLGGEVRLVQNPAIGAFLLWRFTCAYKSAGGETPYPNVLLLFLVLPLTLHEGTRAIANSTLRKSGLRMFAAKFSASDQKKTDLLYSIHPRVQVMRKLTLESLRVAVATNLLAIDAERGLVYARSHQHSKSVTPAGVSDLVSAAERLGEWCAQVTFGELASSHKVEF